MIFNTDIENIKKRQQIDYLINEYYDFISKPMKVMAAKDKLRFDEEETEQLLRVIMVYHVLWQDKLVTVIEYDMPEFGICFVDKSDDTLYNKMVSLKKKYKKELIVLKIISRSMDNNCGVITRNPLNDRDYADIISNFKLQIEYNWEWPI